MNNQDRLKFKTDSILFLDNQDKIFSKIESHKESEIEFSDGNNLDIILKGISLPISENDAANKKYVDSFIIDGIDNSGGFIEIVNNLQSTSPNDGSLVVNGGLGVKKNLNIGGILKSDISTITSDITKKENISNLNNLEYLDCLYKKINCYSYSINDKKATGFIAQEIEKIPELKFSNIKHDDGTLSLNYNNFISLNTQMIKKLIERIERIEDLIFCNSSKNIIE